MSEPTIADLRKNWDRARTAWNRDNGTHEQTVKCGEELYFAAAFLIDALTEETTK